jgi:hypothetical protein
MPEETIRFDPDIKSLFREKDRDAMVRIRGFDLWSHDDVRANADAIVAQLEAGRMPCDGAWPPGQVATFRRWMDGGMAD